MDPADLPALLEGTRAALVVTGAGVSLASGIPTFRGTDRDAVWAHDVTTLGTLAFFREDPVTSWRWYLARFDRVLSAAPNAAHHALAALERWHRARGAAFLLVTQNVDPLHERAGSQALVKVHGSADRVRCASDGCAHGAPTGSLPRPEADLTRFAADPRLRTVPRCPACGDTLRPHVLWFDETYGSHADYQFLRVLRAADAADFVVFVGTSFAVGVTEAILDGARRRRTPIVSIDPGDHPVPFGVTRWKACAEAALPEACRAIGAR